MKVNLSRTGSSPTRSSLPRLSFYALGMIGSLLGSSAQAGYLLSGDTSRGSVSYGGTSLGAFSHSATTFAFQSVVTTSDLAVYEAGVTAGDPTQTYYFSPEPLPIPRVWIADGLVDRFAPVGTTISGSYPTGTGDLAEPLIQVDYYGPDATAENPSLKRYLLDGGVALSYKFETQVEGAVRYNFSIQGVNPVDATTYSYLMSGVITFGLEDAADTYSSSYALRSSDNQLVITGKTSGVASIPEPSACALWLGLAAALGTVGMRRPDGSRSRA